MFYYSERDADLLCHVDLDAPVLLHRHEVPQLGGYQLLQQGGPGALTITIIAIIIIIIIIMWGI